MDSEEQFSSILSSQETAVSVAAGTAGKLEFSTREEKGKSMSKNNGVEFYIL